MDNFFAAPRPSTMEQPEPVGVCCWDFVCAAAKRGWSAAQAEHQKALVDQRAKAKEDAEKQRASTVKGAAEERKRFEKDLNAYNGELRLQVHPSGEKHAGFKDAVIGLLVMPHKRDPQMIRALERARLFQSMFATLETPKNIYTYGWAREALDGDVSFEALQERLAQTIEQAKQLLGEGKSFTTEISEKLYLVQLPSL